MGEHFAVTDSDSKLPNIQKETRTLSAVAFGSCALVFLPHLLLHFRNLWRYDQFQFFPLLLILILVFVNVRGFCYSDFAQQFAFLNRPQFLLVMTGLMLLGAGIAVRTPNATMLAFVIFLSGIVWRLSSISNASLWRPWALLLLMVRLPGAVEGKLIGGLQRIGSRLSSFLLDSIGINHLMAGNVLHISGKDLFVDEACSGIVSLFSILAFGAVYAVYVGHSVFRTFLLLLASVGCALMINVLRISTIAIADQWYQLDVSAGPPHQLLGIALFGVTLGIFFLIDRLLELILKPVPTVTGERRDQDFFEKAWNRIAESPAHYPGKFRRSELNTEIRSGRAYVFAAGVSIIISGLWIARETVLYSNDYSRSDSVAIARRLDPSIFSKTIDGFQRFESVERDPTSPDGAFSSVFNVDSDDQIPFDFSIDYPFFGDWHELTVCYASSGWKITGRKLAADNETVSVDLVNETGGYGFLVFKNISVDGTAVSPPDTTTAIGWTLSQAKARMFKGVAFEVLQYQLWCPTSQPLTDEEKTVLKTRFDVLSRDARKVMFPVK